MCLVTVDNGTSHHRHRYTVIFDDSCTEDRCHSQATSPANRRRWNQDGEAGRENSIRYRLQSVCNLQACHMIYHEEGHARVL